MVKIQVRLKHLIVCIMTTLIASSAFGKHNFVNDEETMLLISHQAITGWIEIYSRFNRARLFNLVMKDSKSTSSELSKADLNFVLDIRQSAQRVRSIFNILGRKHRSPDKFNDFIIVMGDYKDAFASVVRIQSGEFSIPMAEARQNLRDKANILLKVLREYDPRAVEEKFELSELTDINSYIDKRLDFIESVAFPSHQLGHFESFQIPAEEYHKLRKDFRDFLVFLESYAEVGVTDHYGDIIDRLIQVKKKMGVQIDDLIQESLGDDEVFANSQIRVSRGVGKAADHLLTLMGRPSKKAKMIPKFSCFDLWALDFD